MLDNRRRRDAREPEKSTKISVTLSAWQFSRSMIESTCPA